MSSTCPACRRELPRGAQFCGYCGFKLSPVAAADAAPILLTRVKRKTTPESTTARAEQQEPVELTTPKKKAPQSPATLPRSQAQPVQVPSTREKSEAPRHPSERARPRPTRFPLKIEVNYGSDHNFYTGFMENISSGGLFIATHAPAEIGTVLEVAFSVPGLDDPCSAMVKVCWIREYDPNNDDMIPGMGCRFGPLKERVKAAIDTFIQHREPIFFD